MFFILSKILFFLIQPLNWVVGLLIYAIITKKEKRKRIAVIFAAFLVLFFTNKFIFNQVVHLWEVDTLTADKIIQPYDIGIVLGGYSSGSILPNHDRLNFSSRGNRFFNAYELYKSGKVQKLLLSGGTGRLIESGYNEAIEMKAFLMKIGVPETDIIVEDQSRNTFENALYSKKILDEYYPGANCLLITSAWHMRRSMKCFDKVDQSYTPFSVDHLGEQQEWYPSEIIIPDRDGFAKWEYIIKEWIGMLAYWIKGYN